MNILTNWLRHYLPALPVDDRQLADDLTLRGIAVEGVHSLGPNNGHLFEMDITTNRVDAMNHYGIAREAATIYNLPLAPLLDNKDDAVILTLSDPELVEGESKGKNPRISSESPKPYPITIEAKTLCGRFTAQVLRNVTIAPSTGQVAEYFTLLNQKQISNAVDASNFTLLGMGHPTHAFDLDKLEGGIIVRLAHKGEKLKLLDGTERTLEADDLVVADEKKVLALAGVMGGYDSMITPETKNILVEAAWFDPAAIRRSSRRHGLHTDASHRFERGADFNAAPIANALVSKLILEHGGHAEGALIDVVIPEIEAKTANRPAIQLSIQQVQRHLGTTLEDTPTHSALTADLVHQYLTSLGCNLTGKTADTFQVELPSWRLDLEREIDLIEEIARVYGYNRFANTLPTALPVIAHPTAQKESVIRARLFALGYSEAISSTFASELDATAFAAADKAGKRTVPMENPLSEEASLLRPSLIPGMLAMLAHNLNRDVKNVRLFEQGQVFTGTIPPDGTFISEVHETPQLSLGLTGDAAQTNLYPAEDAPIFELKGAIASLLSIFTPPGGPSALTFSAVAPTWLEPGRSATALLNNQPIAHFGQLAAPQLEARKLRQSVFLAQIDLARLYELPLRRVTAHELSRFQAVERDFSFVFPNAVHWHAIAAAIHALAIPELQSLKPIEVWRNEKKYPGVYSHLIRTVFQSHDRTLRDEELTQWSTQIIDTLTALGGTLRA
ncbi:MAG: phenylalanine--tRNA ligase subunit beta [Edaphobacter sp.]